LISGNVESDIEHANSWRQLIADIMEKYLPEVVGAPVFADIDLTALRHGDVTMTVTRLHLYKPQTTKGSAAINSLKLISLILLKSTL